MKKVFGLYPIYIPCITQIYVQINRDSNDDPAIHDEAKKLFNKMEHGKMYFYGLLVITSYLCLFSRSCFLKQSDLSSHYSVWLVVWLACSID